MSAEDNDMWGGVFAYQKKMADYGNPEAQVKLGEMYEEGHGTGQDYDMAQQWYEKAAAQGHAPAKKKLSDLDARRKREAKAAQQRKAEEAQRKREAAERARAEKKRKAQEAAAQRKAEQEAKEKAEQERLAKEKAEKEAAEKARKAEEERLARERAEQAMKEMMATPSAYAEE